MDVLQCVMQRCSVSCSELRDTCMSCVTYEWVARQIRMSHVTCEFGISNKHLEWHVLKCVSRQEWMHDTHARHSCTTLMNECTTLINATLINVHLVLTCHISVNMWHTCWHVTYLLTCVDMCCGVNMWHTCWHICWHALICCVDMRWYVWVDMCVDMRWYVWAAREDGKTLMSVMSLDTHECNECNECRQ